MTIQGVSDFKNYYSKYKLVNGVPRNGYIPLPLSNGLNLNYDYDLISFQFKTYTYYKHYSMSYMSYETLLDYKSKANKVNWNNNCTIYVYNLDISSSIVFIECDNDIKLIFGTKYFLSTKFIDCFLYIQATNTGYLVDTRNWFIEVFYGNSGIE